MSEDTAEQIQQALSKAFTVSFHDEGGVYLGDIGAAALRELLIQQHNDLVDLHNERDALRQQLAHTKWTLQEIIDAALAASDGLRASEPIEAVHALDSNAPWCTVLGHAKRENCGCGPIAEND